MKNMDEFLEIHLELRPRVASSGRFRKALQEKIFQKLCEINLEFLDASKRFPEKVKPRVYTWPYQHQKYFKPGLKPHYITA